MTDQLNKGIAHMLGIQKLEKQASGMGDDECWCLTPAKLDSIQLKCYYFDDVSVDKESICLLNPIGGFELGKAYYTVIEGGGYPSSQDIIKITRMKAGGIPFTVRPVKKPEWWANRDKIAKERAW